MIKRNHHWPNADVQTQGAAITGGIFYDAWGRTTGDKIADYHKGGQTSAGDFVLDCSHAAPAALPDDRDSNVKFYVRQRPHGGAWHYIRSPINGVNERLGVNVSPEISGLFEGTYSA